MMMMSVSRTMFVGCMHDMRLREHVCDDLKRCKRCDGELRRGGCRADGDFGGR